MDKLYLLSEMITLVPFTSNTNIDYLILFLTLGVLTWFLVITILWIRAAIDANVKDKPIWYLLVTIFVLSALAGYGSWVLMLFSPKIAIIIRLVFLISQNIICPIFYYLSQSRKFMTIDKYTGIGKEVVKVVKSLDHLGDRELASLVRQLVAINIDRTNKNDRSSTMV